MRDLVGLTAMVVVMTAFTLAAAHLIVFERRSLRSAFVLTLIVVSTFTCALVIDEMTGLRATYFAVPVVMVIGGRYARRAGASP